MTKTARVPRDRLTVAYRDGVVEVGCPCGAESVVAADEVELLMEQVKAFIGAHAGCAAAAIPAQRRP